MCDNTLLILLAHWHSRPIAVVEAASCRGLVYAAWTAFANALLCVLPFGVCQYVIVSLRWSSSLGDAQAFTWLYEGASQPSNQGLRAAVLCSQRAALFPHLRSAVLHARQAHTMMVQMVEVAAPHLGTLTVFEALVVVLEIATRRMATQTRLSGPFVMGTEKMYPGASSTVGLKPSCTIGYFTKLCADVWQPWCVCGGVAFGHCSCCRAAGTMRVCSLLFCAGWWACSQGLLWAHR